MRFRVIYLWRALAIAVALLATVYSADYFLIRYRIERNRNPYGSVRIRRSYAVTMKNNKPEYYFDQPVEENCTHSLFPHFGYAPCWYLQRQADQQIKM